MYWGPESESHGNITASTWKSLDTGREGSRLRSLLQQIQATLCPANHSKESADILYILSPYVWCVYIYMRVCIYVLCVFMYVMCVFICVYLYASMCVFSLLMCNHHEEYEGKWSGDKDDSTTSPSTPHIQSSLSATASGGWVTSGIKYLKWTFLYLSRCIHSSCHRI